MIGAISRLNVISEHPLDTVLEGEGVPHPCPVSFAGQGGVFDFCAAVFDSCAPTSRVKTSKPAQTPRAAELVRSTRELTPSLKCSIPLPGPLCEPRSSPLPRR